MIPNWISLCPISQPVARLRCQLTSQQRRLAVSSVVSGYASAVVPVV